MKVEELLKQRWKVIADYPYSCLSIGFIVSEPVPIVHPQAIAGSKMQLDYFDKYPHLFKKLGWWQDRKQEEMPEYVKYKFMPDSEWRFIKVDRHLTNYFGEENLNIFLAKDDFFSYSKSLPLTEQEYLNQITP